MTRFTIIHSQLSMAEAMQRRLLPPIPNPAAGVEWAAVLAPAGRVGGDFFDFVEPAPGLRVSLIADVSGKGISAAMALTLLRFTFRQMARQTHSPADVAARMSTALYEEWHGSPYVTGVIARVDLARRTLTYANAGHPPGIFVHAGNERELAEGGPPLGLLSRAPYAEEQLDLVKGDVCAFMTDGITEALDDGLRSWRAVVMGAVIKEQSAHGVCSAIMSLAREGHGPAGVDGWTDDQTAVVVAVNEDS